MSKPLAFASFAVVFFLLSFFVSYTGFVTKNVSTNVTGTTLNCLFFSPSVDSGVINTLLPINVTNRNCGNQNYTANSTIQITDVINTTIFSANSSSFNLSRLQEHYFSGIWSIQSPIGIYILQANTDFATSHIQVTQPIRIGTGGVFSLSGSTLNKTIINISDQLEKLSDGYAYSHFITPSETIQSTLLDYCATGSTTSGTSVVCSLGSTLVANIVYNMSFVFQSSSISLNFTSLNATPSPQDPPSSGGGGGSSRTQRVSSPGVKLLLLDAKLPQEILHSSGTEPILIDIELINTGEVPLTELFILPVTPGSWGASGATVASLDVGESTKRVISLHPRGTTNGIHIIPFVFLTQGRVVLRSVVVVQIEGLKDPAAASGRKLDIIRSPADFEMAFNEKGELILIIKNTGNTTLTNIQAKLENYEQCLDLEGTTIITRDQLYANEPLTLSWAISAKTLSNNLISGQFSLQDPTCALLFRVTTDEGVSAVVQSTVQLVEKKQSDPRPALFTGVLIIVIIAIIIVALARFTTRAAHTRQMKTRKSSTKKRNAT